MKLLNQNGMSLKPIAVMLVILAGLTYYILNDIKKIQTIPVNGKNKTAEVPAEVASEKKTVPNEANKKPDVELIQKLIEGLKKPGACPTAFINRDGRPAKFLNTEEIPANEDIVKIILNDEVILEIDKEVGAHKVQDIYLFSDNKAPLQNLGSNNVMAANLQIVWQPKEGGEQVLGKPISLELVVDSSDKVIKDCYRGDAASGAPVILPQPSTVPAQPVQVSPPTQTIVKENAVGNVCGVVSYECSGSFAGETPFIESHPALQTEGTFCEGHVMAQPKCVFVDAFRGFRLEGLSCPDGYRAITHPGQLSDVQSGSGSVQVTKALQVLMVLCVKQ
jgi:hypothetical protein